MRILILSQWFHPEPHFKGLPFARELAKRRHEVEILTGFPKSPGESLSGLSHSAVFARKEAALTLADSFTWRRTASRTLEFLQQTLTHLQGIYPKTQYLK